MPHIIIEYSANVADHHDIDALVGAIHGAAAADGIGPLAGLRTRAARRDFYRIADQDSANGLIAIVARIGPGRTAEAKRNFMHALMAAAEVQLASESDALVIAFSSEIQEIDADFRINHNHVRTRMEAAAAAAEGNAEVGVQIGGAS